MASAWIFHDSAESPPERTIATGISPPVPPGPTGNG
jgi:hypothetical protein